MFLHIDEDEYEVFMKYNGGLANYIQKKLKLFFVDIVEEAIVEAIAIAARNHKSVGKQKSSNKLGMKNKKKMKSVTCTTSEKNYRSHCRRADTSKGIIGHPPEVRCRRKKRREKSLTTQVAKEHTEASKPDTRLPLVLLEPEIADKA